MVKGLNNDSKEKFFQNIFGYASLFFISIILFGILFFTTDSFLYSGSERVLYLLLFLVVLLFLYAFIIGRMLYKKYFRGFYYYVFFFLTLLSVIIGVIYGIRCLKAFRCDNDIEIYNLATKYDLEIAKELKYAIDNIFEYDFDDISSRDVVISNLYEDDGNYILYLDDIYGNYSLKFYLEIENNKILSVIWKFDEKTDLYLYKDGKKTESFSYYYAMYIIKNVLGENIKTTIILEDDIEKKLRNEFLESANAIITYDEFIYDKNKDEFVYKCFVENMDYYADISQDEFEIEFKRLMNASGKKVWYYGDSSFDYVKWSVNILKK